MKKDNIRFVDSSIVSLVKTKNTLLYDDHIAHYGQLREGEFTFNCSNASDKRSTYFFYCSNNRNHCKCPATCSVSIKRDAQTKTISFNCSFVGEHNENCISSIKSVVTKCFFCYD